jgi:hypothetical protein
MSKGRIGKYGYKNKTSFVVNIVTDEYREGYDKIDWSDGALSVEKPTYIIEGSACQDIDCDIECNKCEYEKECKEEFIYKTKEQKAVEEMNNAGQSEDGKPYKNGPEVNT